MNMQIVNMSFEEWKDKYKPILNPLNETKKIIDDEDYQIHWGTLEENDLLKDHIGTGQVWTVVEGERDSVWLVSGYHRVNREYHYICSVPYNIGKEEIQIELWEGYPEILQEDLDNLNKIIEKYEAEYGSDDVKIISANKIAEYIQRVGLN